MYWTVRTDDGELDTLIRAPASGGYVIFGWGYSKMVGSNVVIAAQDPSGAATIGDYYLANKKSSGVFPSDIQGLTNTEAEIAGKFVAGVFTRKLVRFGVPTIASGDVHGIWAVGPRPSAYNILKKHTKDGSGNFPILTTRDDNRTALPRRSSPSPASAGTSPRQKNPTCIVAFKSKDRVFGGCRKLTLGVEVYWTIRKNDEEIDTLFRAPKNVGYVGFGWGYKKMVPSNVVIVFQDSSGKVGIDDYFLEEKSTRGVQPRGNQVLKEKEAEVVGEYISGFFVRKLAIEGLPTISEGEMDALWAVGPQPTSAKTLSRHNGDGRGQIDLSVVSGDVDLRSRFSSLFIVHGVLMVVSWYVLTPAAILSVRFFKKYDPYAFHIHRALNFVSGLVFTASFVMATVKGSHTRIAHLAIGSIAFVASLIQVAGGILRPKREGHLRQPWAFGHLILGYVLVALAQGNAWLGLTIIGASEGYFIGCGIAVGIFVLIFAVLSLIPSKLPVGEEGYAANKRLLSDESASDAEQ